MGKFPSCGRPVSRKSRTTRALGSPRGVSRFSAEVGAGSSVFTSPVSRNSLRGQTWISHNQHICSAYFHMLRHRIKPQWGKQVRGISRRSMPGYTRKRARIGVGRLPQESGQPFRKVGGMLAALRWLLQVPVPEAAITRLNTSRIGSRLRAACACYKRGSDSSDIQDVSRPFDSSQR